VLSEDMVSAFLDGRRGQSTPAGWALIKRIVIIHLWMRMTADLIDNPDRQVGERDAVLTLSVLVGAISMARAVDDPDLSQRILTNAAAALKQRIPN
jgi:hypothetical protein